MRVYIIVIKSSGSTVRFCSSPACLFRRNVRLCPRKNIWNLLRLRKFFRSILVIKSMRWSRIDPWSNTWETTILILVSSIFWSLTCSLSVIETIEIFSCFEFLRNFFVSNFLRVFSPRRGPFRGNLSGGGVSSGSGEATGPLLIAFVHRLTLFFKRH